MFYTKGGIYTRSLVSSGMDHERYCYPRIIIPGSKNILWSWYPWRRGTKNPEVWFSRSTGENVSSWGRRRLEEWLMGHRSGRSHRSIGVIDAGATTPFGLLSRAFICLCRKPRRFVRRVPYSVRVVFAWSSLRIFVSRYVVDTRVSRTADRLWSFNACIRAVTKFYNGST